MVFSSPMKPSSAGFMAGAASPMVMQSPARHETPKKMTMTVAKSAKRQKVMEACLRKVKANRHSLVSSMRAGGLTPASFRSEIGKLVNYEWSTMENGAGVAPNSAMHVVDPDYQGLRQEELEEAEYAETIIALEQAFLEDIRREGTFIHFIILFIFKLFEYK
jgi:hypothetical protein